MIKSIVLVLSIFVVGMLAFAQLISHVGNIAFIFLGGFVLLIVYIVLRIIRSHQNKDE